MITEVSIEIVNTLLAAKLSPPYCIGRFGKFETLEAGRWFVGKVSEREMDTFLRMLY